VNRLYLTECLYYATSHTLAQGLVLASSPHLLDRAFATQMTLTGFTVRYFSGSSYFETFGYTFVGLSHLIP
jgi:hypothetical protein